MAKGQWWEQLKNPPKWVAPAYLVLAITMGGFVVYKVVRGGEWFIFLMLFLVFGFNAWANWYQRRKVAKSQNLQR